MTTTNDLLDRMAAFLRPIADSGGIFEKFPLTRTNACELLAKYDRLRASQAQQVAGGYDPEMRALADMAIAACENDTETPEAWAKRMAPLLAQPDPTPEADAAAPVAFAVIYPNQVSSLQWANAEGERDDYEDFDERYGQPIRIGSLYAGPVNWSARPAATEAKAGAVTDAIRRMDECRAGCDIGEPFYADVAAWETIRAALIAALAPSSPTGEPEKAGE